jgi:hypothetical protein
MVSEDLERASRAALRESVRLFPQLSDAAFYEWRSDNECFVMGAHLNTQAIDPLCYAHAAEDAFLVYDGLPIEPSGNFSAHRAGELLANWDRVPGDLEGQFNILRIRRNPTELVLCNDFFAGKPIYLARLASGWLLSNSTGLLRAACNLTAFDALGVSAALGCVPRRIRR